MNRSTASLEVARQDAIRGELRPTRRWDWGRTSGVLLQGANYSTKVNTDGTTTVTDDDATVRGQQDDLSILLVATSSIPGQVLKHRLRLLAGSAWELRDVSAA